MRALVLVAGAAALVAASGAAGCGRPYAIDAGEAVPVRHRAGPPDTLAAPSPDSLAADTARTDSTRTP